MRHLPFRGFERENHIIGTVAYHLKHVYWYISSSNVCKKNIFWILTSNNTMLSPYTCVHVMNSKNMVHIKCTELKTTCYSFHCFVLLAFMIHIIRIGLYLIAINTPDGLFTHQRKIHAGPKIVTSTVLAVRET